MTLRQRIQALMAHGGFDPVLVSATLDVDLSVVEHVLTDPAYTPAEPSGSSVVDLGVIRSTDLLANGRTVIYTPSDTDYVAITPAPADLQIPNNTEIVIAHAAIGVNDLVNPSTTSLDSVNPIPGRVYTAAAPIYAYLRTEGGAAVSTPPPAWAALHLYAANSLIHGPDDHLWLWSSSDSGTSGGTIPDFAGNEGGTVADGSVTWIDEGPVPTTGAIHLYAIVTPLG